MCVFDRVWVRDRRSASNPSGTSPSDASSDTAALREAFWCQAGVSILDESKHKKFTARNFTAFRRSGPLVEIPQS